MRDAAVVLSLLKILENNKSKDAAATHTLKDYFPPECSCYLMKLFAPQEFALHIFASLRFHRNHFLPRISIVNRLGRFHGRNHAAAEKTIFLENGDNNVSLSLGSLVPLGWDANWLVCPAAC
ncbi:hypothetical protein ACJX0J_005994 [Zea mays]